MAGRVRQQPTLEPVLSPLSGDPRPPSGLGNNHTTISKLPVAGSRLPKSRTVLKERTDHNKRPTPVVASAEPTPKRRAVKAATLPGARSSTASSRQSIEPSLSPMPRAVRNVAASASPQLTRPEHTMIWDVAPPSDMPSSSAFGDDNSPGTSDRTSRGRAVRGAGRLMTPVDSQEISLARKEPSSVNLSRSINRSLPTPTASMTIVQESPPTAPRIQARDSLSPPLRTRSTRRRTNNMDATEREDEPSNSPSPMRKRPRTNGSKSSALEAPSTLKPTRQVSSTRTPAAYRSDRLSAEQQPPATVPAKGNDRAEKTRRLSTPVTFRPSETPITPSMRRETTSFKRGLSPNAREILRGVFVGTSDIALQPEPGDDPILLMARRRLSRSKSTGRSSKSTRKSARKSSGKKKAVIRVEDGDLAEYGDDSLVHIPSDAFDGPEDTFAAVHNGSNRITSMLGERRLSASAQLQAVTNGEHTEAEDLEQPANQHSPFVHRAERTRFSPSEGPGLSSLSRLVALDRAVSPSGSEVTARDPPSPVVEQEDDEENDYDAGYFAPDLPSPSMSPEPFFQGAPTPDDSDAEPEQGETVVETATLVEHVVAATESSVQALLDERRAAAARRTASASPFSPAGSAAGLASPTYTDELSIDSPGEPAASFVTKVVDESISDAPTPRRGDTSNVQDNTARQEDITVTSTAVPVDSPLAGEDEEDSFDAEDDTIIVQEDDLPEDVASPAKVPSPRRDVPGSSPQSAPEAAEDEVTGSDIAHVPETSQPALPAVTATDDTPMEPEPEEPEEASMSHMSTLAAEFLDGLSSDEEDVTDEETAAMLLRDYSQDEVDVEGDTIIVEDESAELSVGDVGDIIQRDNHKPETRDSVGPVKEPQANGNQSPAQLRQTSSPKVASAVDIAAVPQSSPLILADDDYSADSDDEAQDFKVSLSTVIVVGDEAEVHTTTETVVVSHAEALALEEEDEQSGSDVASLDNVDVSADTIVTVASDSNIDLDVSAATIEVEDDNDASMRDLDDSGMNDEHESNAKVNYTPPRYGIDEVVQAALSVGMVIDGEAAAENAQAEVRNTQHEPPSSRSQRKSSPSPGPSSKPPSSPPQEDEPALPLRVRRKMDAGSTPVRPRFSGSSQHPSSPTPASVPRQTPSIVVENSQRRSPRLSHASLDPVSPVRRSARLSQDVPVVKAHSFIPHERSPLQAHVELAPVEMETDVETEHREASAHSDGHVQSSPASPLPHALRGSIPTPSPLSVVSRSPIVTPSKGLDVVEPVYASLQKSISTPTRRALQPSSPLLRVDSPAKSPAGTPRTQGPSSSPSQPAVVPKPFPTPTLPSPAAKSSTQGRTPVKLPASPAVLISPSSDSGEDIGADDTMEGDSEAWNMTSTELMFDAEATNIHFEAHRFVGEAWDVTRIERAASSGKPATPSAGVPSSPPTLLTAHSQLSPRVQPPHASPQPRPSRTPVPSVPGVQQSRIPVPNGKPHIPLGTSVKATLPSAQVPQDYARDDSAQLGDVEDEGLERSGDEMGEDAWELESESEEEEEDDGRILLAVVARGVVKLEDDSMEEEATEQVEDVNAGSATLGLPSREHRLSSPIELERSPSSQPPLGPSTQPTLEPSQPKAKEAQPPSPAHAHQSKPQVQPLSQPSVLRSPQSVRTSGHRPIPQPPSPVSQRRETNNTLGIDERVHHRAASHSTRPVVPSTLSHEISLDTSSRSLFDELSSVVDDEVVADDSFRSVVEVSSLDPRAAARAAAILKMNHRYIEHGILDSTPRVSTSRLPETPFTAGERTEVYESMEAELRKQRLLHDAELDLVLGDRSVRSMSVFTSASVMDSPLHIPGAWRRTPKRKRHVEEATPRHEPEVVAEGRPWRGKDWKRLHRVYRVERAKWVNERETRPLPGATSGYWTPFRRTQAQTVPQWDNARVADAFIQSRQLKEEELVGEWSRNVITNRVAGIEARFGEETDEDRCEPSPKRARVDAPLVPPSTVKRMLNWVWGLGTAAKQAQATPQRTVSGELERAERGESRSPDAFIQRNDDTVDFDVTMATPSRDAVETRLKQQTRDAPEPRPRETRPMRQLPNIAHVESTPRSSRTRARCSASGRSPSAPAMRSPSPERSGTQLEPEQYRYDKSSSRLYPPLYPALPDRSAALSERSFYDRTFDRTNTVSGTPGPKVRIRSASGPTPHPLSARSRDPPNVRNLVRGFEETSRLDLSFESERREREKNRLRSLRRVRSTVEHLRDLEGSVSNVSMSSLRGGL